jgi:phospholipid transport system substrate-binding protein
MKKLLLIGILLVATLFANDEDKITYKFIKKTDEIIKIVKNKSQSKDLRNENIVKAIEPMFDFKLMAKLSLGKKVWRSLTSEKQEEFTKLYVNRMKTSYSSKVDKYTDEEIVIEKIKRVKKTRITLITTLISGDSKTEVVYKYYKPKKPIDGKDEWLVYDVVVLGVSIIKTDKSQFREVLRSSTIEQLMDKLKK